MEILITGATGFIGRRAAEAFLDRGASVRCLVRSMERAAPLGERGARLIRGALDTGEGIEEAVRGAECVLHSAGAVRAWTRREYFAANEGGTRRLAEAARRAGVSRFVLLSSLAASGPSAPGRPVAEDDPPRPVNDYGASKLAAERALREAFPGPGSIAIRPCAVYGPGDRDFLELFRAVSRGWALWAGPAGARLSLVFVDDLVELCRLAIERAPPESTYMAAHPVDASWPEIVAAIERALGRVARKVRIPPALLVPVVWAAALGRPFRSRPPLLSRGKLVEARQAGWAASAEKARRELGWTAALGLDDGIARTARWYEERGWLPARRR